MAKSHWTPAEKQGEKKEKATFDGVTVVKKKPKKLKK
jgi:hypothetical protein